MNFLGHGDSVRFISRIDILMKCPLEFAKVIWDLEETSVLRFWSCQICKDRCERKWYGKSN